MARKALLTRGALVAVLVLAGAVSHAVGTADLDAQARDALKNAQYRQAISLTREITRVDPQSTLNWYRMAIAAEKERDYALAARALQTAERLDPSLSFASSPERVALLKANITAGGGIIPAQVLARADGAEDDALQANPAKPAGGNPQNAPVADKGAGGAPAAPAPEGVAAAGLALPAAVAPAEPGWTAALVGYSLLLVGVLVALLLAIKKAASSLARRRTVNVATMPLDDFIVHCRDELALLQQRLEYHGHQDTEIAVVLQRLQPAFARECGRSRISLEHFKDDRPLADVKQQLPTRIPVLGPTSAAQVHMDAVQQALQQQVLQQQRRA